MLPTLARLDGRTFHSFCKHLDRPFDTEFCIIMQKVTDYLVEQTNALVGYTQSDEITLLWYTDDPKSQIFFGGKLYKMISILASMCSVRFNQLCHDYNIYTSHDSITKAPVFDCRVWQVPTFSEALNTFIWREFDAVRNSIQLAGQACFSHKQLHEKSCKQIQEMLFQEKQINWNDYPPHFKRGTYYQKYTKLRAFTPEEIDRLPLEHEARTNPNLNVTRQSVRKLEMPPITKIENLRDVFFSGQLPTLKTPL